jgi:uncharacterized protein (TIGR02246 family)
MKLVLAIVLGAFAAGALAAEATVMRPRGFVGDEWAYYVVIGGKAVSDLMPGERVTITVPDDTRALAIHCPKIGGGYEQSRVEHDFRAKPRAFFSIATTRDCVQIDELEAAAAAPLVRRTVARANRRMEYDPGNVAAAASAAPAATDAAPRDQVAAATAAWVEAFNSRDAARVASLYDREAVLSDASEARPRVGAAAIADYYRANAQRATQRAALGEHSIRLFGDTAIDSGTLTYFEMRDGQATTTPVRYSLTYRNQGGKWLIVDHQSSPVPR